MKREKNFEIELPEDYQEIFVVDATKSKLSLLLNGVAILVTVCFLIGAYFLFQPTFEEIKPWRILVYALGLLAYIVLHELVHGAAYKLLTKQKLTFGMTLSVAFCGVPNIYVYRKTALVALLSPFLVFLAAFGGLILCLPLAVDKFFAAILLGFHIGGCSGDLYVTGLYLFKLKDSTILMQDIGPKQTFYSRELSD